MLINSRGADAGTASAATNQQEITAVTAAVAATTYKMFYSTNTAVMAPQALTQTHTSTPLTTSSPQRSCTPAVSAASK
jgi:hypothetical protein